MARSREPFWWLLFAAGGVVAAVLMPVHILLTGIAAPLGWHSELFTYERVRALVSHPLTRLYLFVLISLPLFHWAHRFGFTVIDLGLHAPRRLVFTACYGIATLSTILAALILVRL
jgi:fumarate reductase subunit D